MRVLIRPPVCLIQNPKLVCIRFILWARSVCCLLVHLFLLVLRFACRFKVVLGTARTTQIGGGVSVAKAQRSPCGVVVRQHNVDPPQIELSPTLIERSGANPSGFHQLFQERNPKTITVDPTGSSLIESCPTEFDYVAQTHRFSEVFQAA